MDPKSKARPQKVFMEVPNMNHCRADARRAFPVLLREPPSSRKGGRGGGGGVQGGVSASDGCTVSATLDMTGCSYSCKDCLGGPFGVVVGGGGGLGFNTGTY